jgi:hypothetical protein
VPNHDMVVQLNLEGPGGGFQVARHLDVRARRLGIAGRVIMRIMCPAPLCGRSQILVVVPSSSTR